jgi:hypothetical protein
MLRKRKGAKEEHQVYGVYDIIARLSGGWEILRRLALYGTKEGARSELPERTPTRIREP